MATTTTKTAFTSCITTAYTKTGPSIAMQAITMAEKKKKKKNQMKRKLILYT